MTKVVSLKLNKEFKRAYFQGKFKAHPLLTTYLYKTRGNEARVGITTSKKIGCAVKRNRAKRIIKQAFVELNDEGFIVKQSTDFVFVARPETVLSTTKDVKRVMKKQIEIIMTMKNTAKKPYPKKG